MDLNAAIKAHSDWKIKLRSAITSRATLDVGQIEKDNCCELGKWLHGESKLTLGKLPAHGECIRLHASFHREAARVATAINHRAYTDAEQMLTPDSTYTKASQAVVIAIGSLQRQMRK